VESQFFQQQRRTLSVPTIGEFKNGRGEFFDQETLKAAPSSFDSSFRTSREFRSLRTGILG